MRRADQRVALGCGLECLLPRRRPLRIGVKGDRHRGSSIWTAPTWTKSPIKTSFLPLLSMTNVV